MRLVDANILLYAVDETSPFHGRLRPWLEDRLSEAEPVGFAWVALLAFIRISTRGNVMTRPLTPAEALGIVENWLAQPNVIVLHPTDRHAALLSGLLNESGAGGNLTTDAHLAALAIEYGADLCSLDGDFARFKGMRWINPLDEVGT